MFMHEIFISNSQYVLSVWIKTTTAMYLYFMNLCNNKQKIFATKLNIVSFRIKHVVATVNVNFNAY